MEPRLPGTYAIVVAAGRGRRLGGARPKQYREVAGRPLIGHALAAFARHPTIDAALAVIHADDRALYEPAVAGIEGLLAPVTGGPTRQDSVRRGLEAVAPRAPARVLIHDAARPAVTAALIGRVVAALDGAPAAIPVVPLTDSLKRVDDGRVIGSVDRAGLARAQTPQGFDYAAIRAAHTALAGHALSDDAALAEAAGLTIAAVPGSEDNLKVTREEDLARAERLLAARLVSRVGFGFDVHAFGPGDRVTLCGVAIPHRHALVGHSDADAGLHAAVDAVLGALGAGDIGDHFPPSDPAWKDAPSRRFAAHAGELVGAAGGVIDHLDVTLVCEAPRIGPHREAMRAALAEAFGIAPAAASVKATTAEHLGFLGRGEGIAATAVATLRLPS